MFFLGEKMKLIEHTEYLEMFYVQWDDGIKSQQFYNKTRATELMRRLENGEIVNTVKIGYKV
jgi:hypothetical protein